VPHLHLVHRCWMIASPTRFDSHICFGFQSAHLFRYNCSSVAACSFTFTSKAFSDAKQTPVASIRRRDERSNSVRTLTLTVKRNWFLANGSAKTSVS